MVSFQVLWRPESFVELKENKCEGFIPSLISRLRSILFSRKDQYAMIGKKSGKDVPRVGDTIEVIVKSVSLPKRQIEFELAEEAEL
jgi:exoribonuclease R